MKKWIWMAVCLVVVAVAVLFISFAPGDDIMTIENGVYVVNTTKLAPEVRGYMGATPLKIYIKDDKILKIEALPNDETPGFFKAVKEDLLDAWNGMAVKQAMNAKVDAVSGATFSSKAVQENVRLGLEYYNKNKKK